MTAHPDWRAYLPRAADYYTAHIERLNAGKGTGWIAARCPFHEDGTESLSVNLDHGGWRCHAGCGQGDLLAFEMRRTGADFKDAVRALTGVQV